MKRGAVMLGLLAIVGVVGFLFYSLNDGGAGRSRRDGEGARSQDRSASVDGGSADEANGGKRRGKQAVDDDPNRIDGPELVVRGLVLRLGKPAAGATVLLRRARPTDPSKRLSWIDPRRQSDAPPPITQTKADDEGRFILRAPRRSQVTVTAVAEGTGPASIRLFVPLVRNPADVKLELPDGYSLRGVVVDAKGAALEGARVRCASSGWYTYPLMDEATTGKDGRFEFTSLGRGSHSISIEMEGYPRYRRSFNVPEATEIQLKLFPGGVMQGKITDDRGSPVPDARLLLSFNARGDVMGGRAETITGPDGSYQVENVPLLPVTYAMVEHPDWGRRESNKGELRLPLDPVKAERSLVWNIELASGVTARGIVVDKQSGDPVANAQLTFMKQGAGGQVTEGRFGTSGADGRFELRHLLEGSYTVRVKGERHARTVRTWYQPGQKRETDFFVDGVNDPPEVRIEVERAGRVEGQIKGEPAGTWAQTNVQMADNSGYTSIDETGFFVFESVTVGEGKIVKCWNPQCESEPFTVTEGEVTTIELAGDVKPHFTGVVVGANGDPVPGAYVKACPESNIRNEMRNILSQTWNTARTDAEGRFSLSVQPWQAQQSGSANWAIGAVSYEYPLQVQKGLKLPKKGDSREVRIMLEGGGTISGAVEFEGRGPMPNVRVSVSPHYESKGQQGDARQSRYTYTDLAGKFEVKGIGAGVWNVTVYHSDGKAETMKASAGDTGVNLVLKPTMALAGIVVDENGDPLASVRVGAVILGGAKEQFRWSQTDGSGRFRIAHLEPGDYPIEVTPQSNNRGYYAVPSGAGQTSGFKKTRTRAYPAGTENIVVEVEPGARIKGRVLDPGGQPVPGAGVMAIKKTQKKPKGNRSQTVQPTTFTNGRGEFTLKGVEDGEYEVVVGAAGYLLESTTAMVGQERLEIRVREGGTIKGKLLLPDGKPCGGQWVQLQPQDPEVNKEIMRLQSEAPMGWNNIGGWQRMSTSTSGDGTFEISGLVHGKYRLWLSSPRGVAPQTDLHTDAGLITIRMQPALTIAGKIVTEDGGVPEVKNGQIWINVQQNGRWFAGSRPDSEGNFEVKGLPEGEVTVQVWAANEYQAARETATAGDKNVRIVLKKRAPPPNQKK